MEMITKRKQILFSIIYLSLLVISTILFAIIGLIGIYRNIGWYLTIIFVTFMIFVLAVVIIKISKKLNILLSVVLKAYFYIFISILTIHNVFWLSYVMIIQISPPVILIENEIKKVMPTAQIFLSILISLIISSIIVYKYIRSENIMKILFDKYLSNR